MRGKLLFVVGLGTGYVLGSRAGRQRYEQIKAGADKVWSSQPVQAGVGQVQGFANQQVDKLSGKLADQIRKVLGQLLGLDKGNIEVTVVAKRPARASTPPVTTGDDGETPLTPPVSTTAAE
ncbi:YtxH domain-containing protein [Subtercola lobariae]|uniref:Protoporphyrinogen oxidase n=1 Tax=Subtercola lobariae TaxID=1588641 RepID=A0A917F0L9_9MICO|nr:YtxH domain-containing protein [Subtercola lobariae]GGF36553.1 hypothetical protein GCM10011399_31840 [Subtercola lobariae]